MTKRQNKRKKSIIVLSVLLAVAVFLAATVSFLLAANYAIDGTAHFSPAYARENIESVLQKNAEEWTNEDYEKIYMQTGLSKEGITRVREMGTGGKAGFISRMLKFQDAFFAEVEIKHELVGPVSQRDTLVGRDGKPFYAELAPLRLGDVLVTPACHTLGWRNGHSALVVDEKTNSVLESLMPGDLSSVTNNGAEWFTNCSAFLLLRLKDEYREEISPEEIAKKAERELIGVEYSLTVGIFHKKNQGNEPKYTHCSHLVWQAYKNCGLDIDADGGPVVTSRDIASSPYFEVVQVYGFDPVKLW